MLTKNVHLPEGKIFKMSGLSQERGGILVIALIFLFGMTLIAVASLSGITTQERRAANSNAKHQAERAALSAINTFLTDVENDDDVALEHLSDAVIASESGQGILSLGKFTVPSDTHAANLFLQVLDKQDVDGSSIDDDRNNGGIKALYMEVIARGYSESDAAVTAEIRRGFKYH